MQLAVLIDGENVSPRLAEQVFAVVRTLGSASVLTVFGEFGGPAKSWSDVAARHALEMHQVPSGGKGKNSTDIALTVAAMDLLRDGEIGGFCIVSSDGDFAPLAGRIRRSGCAVHGFGDARAAQRYRDAFTRFHLIGLEGATTEKRQHEKPSHPALPEIHAVLAECQPQGGWYNLSRFSKCARRAGLTPEVRGYAKFSKLLLATEAFDLDEGNQRFRRRLPDLRVVPATA
jgi:hypothetical protein